MRTMRRNKTLFWYATLESKTEITDDYGNATGQFRLVYSDPLPYYANIRWNTGMIHLEPFGLDDRGKRRIVTDDMNCPITETSILWIGIEPDAQGTVKHNYVVDGVIERSLNQIAFNVALVNVK